MKKYTAQEIFELMRNTDPTEYDKSIPIFEILDSVSEETKIEVGRLLQEQIEIDSAKLDKIDTELKNVVESICKMSDDEYKELGGLLGSFFKKLGEDNKDEKIQ